MFMKTIAVGPFEEVASCVTGGTIVAINLLEDAVGNACWEEAYRVHIAEVLLIEEAVACLQSCVIGLDIAIVDYPVQQMF